MLRAMDSAVSGLRAHQQKLDVIGHNIANVNTVGYKSQSYTFKDTMYQSSTSSTRGTGTSGGVNAAQFGYGSLMGTISMDMTASTPTYVGGFSATIDGEGFFVTKSTRNPITVGSADDTETIKGNDFDYTRVGNFKVDSEGYIVDGNGNFVYGFQGTWDAANKKIVFDYTKLAPLRVPSDVTIANGEMTGMKIDDLVGKALEAKNVKINKAGDIEVTVQVEGTDAKGQDAKFTQTITIGKVAIATFQNQEGVTKNGSNYYKATLSDNTGRCSVGAPGEGRATLMPGYLEASNVDMAVEFSEMIMAERGFQANSKIITVSDEILSDLINMKR